VGSKKLEIILYGGPDPTPGTDEAKKEGCICRGKVEDSDGYAVNEICPIHGREARKKIAGQVRQDQIKILRTNGNAAKKAGKRAH
jgi:hypothetical protein